MTSLESALRSVIQVLDQRSIPYAVMGGLAVRVYAIPRFTNDVDLTISLGRDELPALFEALRSINCEIPPPYWTGWLDSVAGLPLFKAVFIGSERSVEIDLFVAETKFQQSLIQRRQRIQVGTEQIAFVSPEDLILLKLIASRPRDLIDVQDILFTMGELNVEYLEKWAKELSISDALQRALSQLASDSGE